MNDVKTTFYKTLNTIVGTNRVDNQEAYIINDYIGRLEATIKDEQQRLYKTIEYIEKHFQNDEGVVCKIIGEYTCERNEKFLEELLDILRGEDNGYKKN